MAFAVRRHRQPHWRNGVVSGGLMPVRASTSDLPRLEVDTRIDPSVRQIGDQVHDHADE